jgi:hypothetical protein
MLLVVFKYVPYVFTIRIQQKHANHVQHIVKHVEMEHIVLHVI